MLPQLAVWREHLTSDYAELSMPPDPSRDHILGQPGAPPQLVGYMDFECPSCQAASKAVGRVRKQLGEEVLVVVRTTRSTAR
jgi:hypothetical protein